MTVRKIINPKLLIAGLAALLILAACGNSSSSTSEGTALVASQASEAPAADAETPTASSVAQTPSTAAPPATAAAQTADADPTASAPPTTAASAWPLVITDETGAEITIESVERIIPLDGTVAEVVFALGMGDNVVATDLSATWPPEADALPEIGYQRSLAAETVAAFNPTILLATDIAGPPGALEDLKRLGYPLVIVPNDSSPEGPGEKVRAVARALGIPERGEELASQIDQEIADNSVSETPENPLTVMALYVRGTTAQRILGESSATNWLIKAAGGADAAEIMGISESAPISAEAILEVAPDVLLIPSAGLESAGGVDGLLQIPGLAETPAGQNRNILDFDDQYLLGNGPRVGRLIGEMRAALEAITGESGSDAMMDADSPEGIAAAAWRVVFDSSADFADKAPHLQGSDALEDANSAYMQGASRFGGFKLEPTAVEIDGDTATVTYNVLFGDAVQYTDQTGTLTLIDGVWQVSRSEYCGFLASARTPCPS